MPGKLGDTLDFTTESRFVDLVGDSNRRVAFGLRAVVIDSPTTKTAIATPTTIPIATRTPATVTALTAAPTAAAVSMGPAAAVVS